MVSIRKFCGAKIRNSEIKTKWYLIVFERKYVFLQLPVNLYEPRFSESKNVSPIKRKKDG
jgi:hypothetical protein